MAKQIIKNRNLNSDRTLFSIRVNRAEFLKLPKRIRRRATRDMAREADHNDWLNTLDEEEDP